MDRETPGALVTDSVDLTSTLKAWGGTDSAGRSSGTEVAFHYRVDLAKYPDLSPIELKRVILDEKRRLDLLCLDAEYLRGSIAYERYKAERAAIRERYGKVLGAVESMETADDLAGQGDD